MTRITATRSEGARAYYKLAFFFLVYFCFVFSSIKEFQHLNRAWQDYLIGFFLLSNLNARVIQ